MLRSPTLRRHQYLSLPREVTRPSKRVFTFRTARCEWSALGLSLARQLWNETEPSLPLGADIDSVFFRLRDQPCPTTLRRPYRSCVSR
jgi:hypothetical protein